MAFDPAQNSEAKPRRMAVLVLAVIILDFVIVGAVYRWHQEQLFAENKQHEIRIAGMLTEEGSLKSEIMSLEGVTAWGDTLYATTSTTTEQMLAPF